MQAGVALEAEVIRWLRMVGCRIKTDRHRDRYQQVDFTVTHLPGQRLPFPAEVQLTMQGGNLLKLERYLKRRSRPRGCSHFYVVAPKNIREPIAGGQIMDFIERKCLVDSAKPGVFGVFLNHRGKAQEFDPSKRLERLRKRASPTASAEQRSVGIITRLDQGGFFIQTKEGGKRGKEPWFAHDGDISDHKLRNLVKQLRKEGREVDEPIHVSFYRHVEQRGKRANKKALSVILHRE